MSCGEVVTMLRGGMQAPLNLRINNIRTIDQLAGRLASQIEADSSTLYRWLASDSVAQNYGFTAESFIAMFIPNTYQVYWTISPEALLKRMKREYDRFWTRERENCLSRTGLSKIEVSILASIVSQETEKADEMPVIAGVYINRLRRNMLLQADPTVKFAVGDFTLRRILKKHLRIDSPYNTYLYPGLPPGPICMPSIAAIDAVLNYQEHDWLYFCAKGDFSGYHNFARTLTEHNRNARAYARSLDKAGIR